MSVESIQATITNVTRDGVLSRADTSAIIKAAKKNIKADEINALAKLYVELEASPLKIEENAKYPLKDAITNGVTTPTFGNTLSETMGSPIAFSALVGAFIAGIFGGGLADVVCGILFGAIVGVALAIVLSPITFLVSLFRHPFRAWRD